MAVIDRSLHFVVTGFQVVGLGAQEDASKGGGLTIGGVENQQQDPFNAM